MGDARSRLTTPSSATAERGAVAAWWSEVKTYELEKRVARRRRVRARNSSYRDTRSRSLQRMVRPRWLPVVNLTNQRHMVALTGPIRMGANANVKRGRLEAAASKHKVDVKPSLGVVVKIKRVLWLVSVLTEIGRAHV